MDISFLISSLAIGNLISFKLQLCAPTILGIIIWLEKKNLKSICNEEKVHSLTRAFNFNLGCVIECSNHLFFFFFIFGNGIATIVTIFFPYFGNSIATNQLQQIFFLLFRQCHCHKSIPQIFFFLRNDVHIIFAIFL